jgi:hypothetical protein
MYCLPLIYCLRCKTAHQYGCKFKFGAEANCLWRSLLTDVYLSSVCRNWLLTSQHPGMYAAARQHRYNATRGTVTPAQLVDYTSKLVETSPVPLHVAAAQANVAAEEWQRSELGHVARPSMTKQEMAAMHAHAETALNRALRFAEGLAPIEANVAVYDVDVDANVGADADAGTDAGVDADVGIGTGAGAGAGAGAGSSGAPSLALPGLAADGGGDSTSDGTGDTELAYSC